MSEVFVIIVTYNGKKWLDRCFGSLRLSNIQIHTIVVDNASVDGTPDYIEQHYPEVELIRSSENLGFGQANNFGIKAALKNNAEYVLLLNQDAWLEASAIATMVELFQDENSLGILSPFHKNYEGTDTERYFKEFVQPNGKLSGNKKYYEVPFIHAACWLMPVSTIRKVGGFDPLFFHYGEDMDYIQRLSYYGLKVAYSDNALIYHLGTNATMEDLQKSHKDRILAMAKNPKGSHGGVFFLLVMGWSKTFQVKPLHQAYQYALLKWGMIYKSRKEQLRPMAFIANK